MASDAGPGGSGPPDLLEPAVDGRMDRRAAIAGVASRLTDPSGSRSRPTSSSSGWWRRSACTRLGASSLGIPVVADQPARGHQPRVHLATPDGSRRCHLDPADRGRPLPDQHERVVVDRGAARVHVFDRARGGPAPSARVVRTAGHRPSRPVVVPAGHIPTVEEALERLDPLRRDGPTPAAFTFRTPSNPIRAAGQAARRRRVLLSGARRDPNPLAARLPQRLADAALLVLVAGHHEQRVRQAVEVRQHELADRLVPRPAGRPPARRAGRPSARRGAAPRPASRPGAGSWSAARPRR